MKNLVVTIFTGLILLSVSPLSAQTNKASLKGQAAKLKTFFDEHAIEKAYLQFDKPYYAAGDTIYFKAYVITGEQNVLSPLSGVLHADLINPQNKITRSIKLQLSNGLAWGDFALPDSLISGNYRVRAYTKLMQSYGSDLFFDRNIPIQAIAGKPEKRSFTKALTGKADLQFFPEGGELVTGVRSKIAFKAINGNGAGVEVSRNILDNNNQVVAKFSSVHLGMGVVELTPGEGLTYRAEINYANGLKSTAVLPMANPGGVGITVSDSAAKISVHINPSKAFYAANKDKSIGLFIYSGGKLTTVSDVMDGPDMRFDIQKQGLHTGITQITLLSAAGEPLCERLVFIDKEDNLKLNITTDKKAYATREKTKLTIHAEDKDGEPIKGHFAVAVIDKSKVMIDEDKEENILTYLLLTSNLKGNIEEPGYYFNNPDNKKRNDLDLVMLTHGYRRFTWKNIVNNEIPPVITQPERALSIAGTAKVIGGKPLNNGQVTLINPAGGGLLSENTNSTGAFRFSDLVFYDSTKFVLNAVNAKGKNETELSVKTEQPASIENKLLYTSDDTSNTSVIQAYLANSKSRHDDYLKHDLPGGRMLKEVKITAVKKVEYRTQSLAGAGGADQVLKMKDIHGGGTLSDMINGRLHGVVFPGPGGGGPPYLKLNEMILGAIRPMLVIVDGAQRQAATGINDINPGDVETIEVLKYASASIYGFAGGGGVLVITTKQGTGRDLSDIKAHGVLPITLSGFYKAREFYAPRYESNASTQRPDLRSTIYWLPEIATDNNGDATFTYYNADGKGPMQIVIEGINTEGLAGAAKFSYEVK